MYCLYVLLSFPFEVTELDADDAEDNVPPPPSSPAADFPAVTETINPVPKKNVTAKKTAAKSEPQSLNWVNIGIMDREAWRAAIHGVAKSRTRLSD